MRRTRIVLACAVIPWAIALARVWPQKPAEKPASVTSVWSDDEHWCGMARIGRDDSSGVDARVGDRAMDSILDCALRPPRPPHAPRVVPLRDECVEGFALASALD